jgi:hypothetical protein
MYELPPFTKKKLHELSPLEMKELISTTIENPHVITNVLNLFVEHGTLACYHTDTWSIPIATSSHLYISPSLVS